MFETSISHGMDEFRPRQVDWDLSKPIRIDKTSKTVVYINILFILIW